MIAISLTYITVIIMLLNILKKKALSLFKYRVVVGKDPLHVAPPALIVFPLLSSTFFCGFAGMIAIRRTMPSSLGREDSRSGEALAAMFNRSVSFDLDAVFSGRFSPSSYLGGRESQAAMEQELQTIKEEKNWQAIFYDTQTFSELQSLCEKMKSFLAGEEKSYEGHSGSIPTSALEEVNQGLNVLRDLTWGLEKDIIANVGKICEIAGVDSPEKLSPASLSKYRKLNFLLNSIDRLEVRGRDSAGIQISFVPQVSADMEAVLEVARKQPLSAEMEKRCLDGDPVDGSIDFPLQNATGRNLNAEAISFNYKTAEIIGKLGRNVRELRKKIAGDAIFKLFSSVPTAFETAFTHTRWASVGSITEENCHPIGNFTLTDNCREKYFPAYGKGFWTIHVVLNGDIDNYLDLRQQCGADGMEIAPELTTDTKIIPLRIEHYLRAGHDLAESFRLALLDFEGSHAIAMTSALEPGKVFLALRGSGQSIYVGIAADRYLFSSELYGLVEETPHFIKMDGEKEPPGGGPGAKGQIFIIDQQSVGGIEGIRSFYYDKTPLVLTDESVKKAEITTRDIDRGSFPHYFLKEIGESSLSVHKTLLGKYRMEADGGGEKAVFSLGEDVIPTAIRDALISREINRIFVIGHGTAAVAGNAIADAFGRNLRGSGITIQAMLASELSGFSLERDLRNTLVIPVTQSGTTTDTNRAVAMARQRGARIIAIVNRRQSDITMKADGVFYTSDGRDIEMAVASTKAFYSQIVAGSVLSLAIASLLSSLSAEQAARELRVLEKAPEMMKQALSRKEEIRAAVAKTVKHKRYWAIVGSGPNKAAADEIRIKLSELCYLTISSDVVENKKHIDLSAEPLIIVCAAGSPESVVGDILKDVAIFRSHKASVVVFADEKDSRFNSVADAVIPIPDAPFPLPVILNTVAGHLFGYYAACAIDDDALFLREFKSRLNVVMVDMIRRNLSAYESYVDETLHTLVNHFAVEFFAKKKQGYFSQGGVQTISDLALLLKYVGGKLPLDDFRHDFPECQERSPVDQLDATLGRAVDELSRPIDAIRHQAKTVTVGTSRKETLPDGAISALLAELSFGVHSMLSSNILLLERLQNAISSVEGYTLYAIDDLDLNGKPVDETTIMIKRRGGISLQMPSRAEKPTTLVGTKKGIVSLGRIYAGMGKTDNAPLVMIPLLGQKERVENLLLVHVKFNEGLPLHERLRLIGKRVNEIKDLVQECNLLWSDNLIADIPIGILLGESAESIVSRIRKNNILDT